MAKPKLDDAEDKAEYKKTGKAPSAKEESREDMMAPQGKPKNVQKLGFKKAMAGY